MNLPKKYLFWVYVSLIACLVACLGDLAALVVFAHLYHGYNASLQTISALGAWESPISRLVSWWWIFIGSVFLLFAFAYGKCDVEPGSAQKRTAWLVAIYAAGEEIGSGIFPGNHLSGHLTSTGIVHNIVGGIGVVALVIAPFVLMRKYTPKDQPSFNHFLRLISLLGILAFVVFSLSRIVQPEYLWLRLRQGIWQRLFVVDYYIFLIGIAFKLLMEYRLPTNPNAINLPPPR
jgi:hypothetical protein